jgi:hypothetical protein
MAERPEAFDPDEEEEELPPAGRRRVTLPFGVVAIALLVCAYFLWDLLPALRYWGSAGEAVDLGRPGSYHLERASDGLYARIEGVAGQAMNLSVRWMWLSETRYDLLAVRDTNILVRRSPRSAAPPLTAQGRLILDRFIPEYAQAFQNLAAARGGAQPRDGHLYVLLDGERPRSGWAVPLQAAGLLALILLNAGSLIRAVGRSRRADRR